MFKLIATLLLHDRIQLESIWSHFGPEEDELVALMSRHRSFLDY